jgi:hypothetical protein
MDALVQEMRQLREVMQQQRQQLEELRRENTQLRTQLSDVLWGRRAPVHDAPFQHQPYAPVAHVATLLANRHDEAPLLSQDVRTPAAHAVEVADEEMRLNQGVKRSTDPAVPATPEKEKLKVRRAELGDGERHD